MSVVSQRDRLIREVRENGSGGFFADPSSWLPEYMASRQRALELVDACLDFPRKTALNNPLSYLLDQDPRPNGVKSRSVAYLHALLRLLTMPSTEENLEALSKLLELGFSMRVLVRALMIMAPKIAAALPSVRNEEAYQQVASSTYAYLLNYLADPGNGQYTDEDRTLLSAFTRYQLLFPLSPAMLIANFLPEIGQEEDTVYFGLIGEVSKYPDEVLWLMKETLQRGWSALSGDQKNLEIELGEVFWEIAEHFRPEDVKRAKSALIEYGRNAGVSEGFLQETEFLDKNTLSTATPDIGEAEGVRKVLRGISNKYPSLAQLSDGEAEQVITELRADDLLNPWTGREDHTFKVISDLVAGMYGMPLVTYVPSRDF